MFCEYRTSEAAMKIEKQQKSPEYDRNKQAPLSIQPLGLCLEKMILFQTDLVLENYIATANKSMYLYRGLFDSEMAAGSKSTVGTRKLSSLLFIRRKIQFSACCDGSVSSLGLGNTISTVRGGEIKEGKKKAVNVEDRRSSKRKLSALRGIDEMRYKQAFRFGTNAKISAEVSKRRNLGESNTFHFKGNELSLPRNAHVVELSSFPKVYPTQETSSFSGDAQCECYCISTGYERGELEFSFETHLMDKSLKDCLTDPCAILKDNSLGEMLDCLTDFSELPVPVSKRRNLGESNRVPCYFKTNELSLPGNAHYVDLSTFPKAYPTQETCRFYRDADSQHQSYNFTTGHERGESGFCLETRLKDNLLTETSTCLTDTCTFRKDNSLVETSDCLTDTFEFPVHVGKRKNLGESNISCLQFKMNVLSLPKKAHSVDVISFSQAYPTQGKSTFSRDADAQHQSIEIRPDYKSGVLGSSVKTLLKENSLKDTSDFLTNSSERPVQVSKRRILEESNTIRDVDAQHPNYTISTGYESGVLASGFEKILKNNSLGETSECLTDSSELPVQNSKRRILEESYQIYNIKDTSDFLTNYSDLPVQVSKIRILEESNTIRDVDAQQRSYTISTGYKSGVLGSSFEKILKSNSLRETSEFITDSSELPVQTSKRRILEESNQSYNMRTGYEKGASGSSIGTLLKDNLLRETSDCLTDYSEPQLKVSKKRIFGESNTSSFQLKNSGLPLPNNAQMNNVDMSSFSKVYPIQEICNFSRDADARLRSFNSRTGYEKEVLGSCFKTLLKDNSIGEISDSSDLQVQVSKRRILEESKKAHSVDMSSFREVYPKQEMRTFSRDADAQQQNYNSRAGYEKGVLRSCFKTLLKDNSLRETSDSSELPVQVRKKRNLEESNMIQDTDAQHPSYNIRTSYERGALGASFETPLKDSFFGETLDCLTESSERPVQVSKRRILEQSNTSFHFKINESSLSKNTHSVDLSSFPKVYPTQDIPTFSSDAYAQHQGYIRSSYKRGALGASFENLLKDNSLGEITDCLTNPPELPVQVSNRRNLEESNMIWDADAQHQSYNIRTGYKRDSLGGSFETLLKNNSLQEISDCLTNSFTPQIDNSLGYSELHKKICFASKESSITIHSNLSHNPQITSNVIYSIEKNKSIKSRRQPYLKWMTDKKSEDILISSRKCNTLQKADVSNLPIDKKNCCSGSDASFLSTQAICPAQLNYCRKLEKQHSLPDINASIFATLLGTPGNDFSFLHSGSSQSTSKIDAFQETAYQSRSFYQKVFKVEQTEFKVGLGGKMINKRTGSAHLDYKTALKNQHLCFSSLSVSTVDEESSEQDACGKITGAHWLPSCPKQMSFAETFEKICLDMVESQSTNTAGTCSLSNENVFCQNRAKCNKNRAEKSKYIEACDTGGSCCNTQLNANLETMMGLPCVTTNMEIACHDNIVSIVCDTLVSKNDVHNDTELNPPENDTNQEYDKVNQLHLQQNCCSESGVRAECSVSNTQSPDGGNISNATKIQTRDDLPSVAFEMKAQFDLVVQEMKIFNSVGQNDTKEEDKQEQMSSTITDLPEVLNDTLPCNVKISPDGGHISNATTLQVKRDREDLPSVAFEIKAQFDLVVEELKIFHSVGQNDMKEEDKQEQMSSTITDLPEVLSDTLPCSVSPDGGHISNATTLQEKRDRGDVPYLVFEMKAQTDLVLKELKIFHSVKQNDTKEDKQEQMSSVNTKVLSDSLPCDVKISDNECQVMEMQDMYGTPTKEQEVPQVYCNASLGEEESLYSTAKEGISAKPFSWTPSFRASTQGQQDAALNADKNVTFSHGIGRVTPLKTRSGPLRIGLSKRAKIKQLHPYLR